jgi:hypothetical protein
VVAGHAGEYVKVTLVSALTGAALIASSLPVLGGDFYLGGLGGLATLSADGRFILSGANSQTSQYKPENGPALNIFGGWDFSQYASIQANYIWNGNDLTLVSTALGPPGASDYQQTRTSQQSSAIADLLVYFRNPRSAVRPYLSGGTGVVWLSSSAKALITSTGSPAIPPQHFSDANIGLRVAVGMDVRIAQGWWFRYSFSETISSNPISDELSPPGQRMLKNFQNLFGFVRRF